MIPSALQRGVPTTFTSAPRLFELAAATILLALLASCGDDSVAPDTTPPETIQDLVALSDSDSTAQLSWTAPGDDGAEGRASRYELRLSTRPATAPDWWDNAEIVSDPPTPMRAGSAETWAVGSLWPDSSYVFAIRSADDESNWSASSNPASVDILSPPPLAVLQLMSENVTSSFATLRWDHPATSSSPIASYQLRVSTEEITEANWMEATTIEGLPDPNDPGLAREFFWTGLAANQRWFVGVKTRDMNDRTSTLETTLVETPTLVIRRGSESPRPSPDLSAALAASSEGDVIELGPGRFTGGGNRNLEISSGSITVRAELTGMTILDFEESGRGWTFLGGNPRLEGLTFQRGRAGVGQGFGGAVYCFGATSPTFEDCLFESNVAIASGGAVACHQRSTPSFLNCVFRKNEAADEGGGIYVEGGSAPLLDQCTFTENEAGLSGGGASFLNSGGQILRSRFERNEAEEYGGAMRFFESSPAIDQTIFEENSVGLGGGALLLQSHSSPTIDRSTFIRNTTLATGQVETWGGAVFCWTSSSPTITGSVFYANASVQGGALLAWLGSVATLTHCTLTQNSAQHGGCVRAVGPDSGFEIRNSILSHSTGGAAVHCQKGAEVNLDCSVIFGNRSGDWTVCVEEQLNKHGNFRADPRFCDSERGDFRLRFDSPCADRTGCGTIGALEAGCTP